MNTGNEAEAPILLLVFSTAALPEHLRYKMPQAWQLRRKLLRWFDRTGFKKGEFTRQGVLARRRDIAKSSAYEELTVALVVACLAKAILPDWHIIPVAEEELQAFTSAVCARNERSLDSPRQLLELLVEAAILPKGSRNAPTLTVADVWFRNGGLDEVDRSEARHFLEFVKALSPTTRTRIVSTLPEDTPGSSHTPPLHNRLSDATELVTIDAFTPLFHDHTNPWDEMCNLFLYERSFHTFGFAIDWAEGHRGAGTKSYKDSLPGEVVVGPSGKKVRLFKFESLAEGESDASVFGKFKLPVLIVQVGPDSLRHLRATGCVFGSDVLFYRCKVSRSFRVSGCVFHKMLSISRCTIREDSILELNTFESDLPWVFDTEYAGRFLFRSNRLPSSGNDERGSVYRALTLHRCQFRERAYIDLGKGPTKLNFYGCHFAHGQFTEVVHSYVQPCGFYWPATEYSSNRDSPYFRFRAPADDKRPSTSFDYGDGDLRITNSSLDGRFVVREHPFPIGQYDRFYGTGINLSGSTISGAIDLERVRLRWLSLENAAFIGGEVFMTKEGLMTSFRVSGVFDWLLLPAERPGIIFDERMYYGNEMPRFSSHLIRRGRIEEFDSHWDFRAFEANQIAQQYEDLRNAFARSPNTDLEEDFCHFKAMYYTNLAQQATERARSIRRYRDRHVPGADGKPVVSSVCLVRIERSLVRFWFMLLWVFGLDRTRLGQWIFGLPSKDKHQFTDMTEPRGRDVRYRWDYASLGRLWRRYRQRMTDGLEATIRTGSQPMDAILRRSISWLSKPLGLVLVLTQWCFKPRSLAVARAPASAVVETSLESGAFLAGMGLGLRATPEQLAREKSLITTGWLLIAVASAQAWLGWWAPGVGGGLRAFILALTLATAFLVSPRLQRFTRDLFHNVLLQLFSCGLYLGRMVVAGAFVMIAFALLYRTANWYNDPLAGVLLYSDGTPVDGATDPLAFYYFSVVTFTTLGYGDIQPTGHLRSVAALEAVLGAVIIAGITVSVVRRFLRR